MDRRFLDLYNQEIAYLRTMGAEFAQEFPKIAGRLGGLDEFQQCRDPFVERLLEGFAFLSARVQLKLDSEFPRFTQSLLDTVYPHYMAPTPSMAIVQFEPDFSDGGIADGFLVPRGSSVFSVLADKDETRCEYRTAHDVKLWPVQIIEANYCTRELASLQIPNLPDVKAGIQIRIKSVGGLSFRELKLDSLVFHLMSTGDLLMPLYEQFFGDAVGVLVQPAARPLKWQKTLGQSSIRSVGFQGAEKLLPYDARSFSGYRLLHEYFAFPRRFMFVELSQLGPSIKSCEQDQLDLIILLQKPNLALEGAINADNFALFCSPVINLFNKRADRIHVTDKSFEFHVVPDRTRPQDFEVYNISKVVGYGSRSEELQEFLPFYSAKDPGDKGEPKEAYYVSNRLPRPLSPREKREGRRSSAYAGSEVYISLVDASSAPYDPDIKQLGVEALCTNRDLPLHMPIGQGRTDFTMEKAVPYTSIRCLGRASSPVLSHCRGEVAWRAINHLATNYLSITDANAQEGASALRDLLRLYGENGNLQDSKQIDGIRSVSSMPITRRIAAGGAIAFARGLEITVTFDEAFFEGSGVFLLGAVLEQLFARYASINSFTETVIKTLGRGEIIRWPLRSGLRQIL
ncbi:MAG: type VI secretion system baseplate subunit TssF [Sedimentisphaerales bacterium]|nr:type VI secretion system baseplate subunit TssF [Sedimentisphaerales bacterium]